MVVSNAAFHIFCSVLFPFSMSGIPIGAAREWARVAKCVLAAARLG